MSVTAAASVRRPRVRQLAVTVASTTRVVTWQPVAVAGVLAVALVSVGAPAGVPFCLSIAGACLAASAAYVIDDAGAVTVASSLTSLLIRRVGRAATATVGVGAAWSAAALVAVLRVEMVAIRPATLELAAFLVLALAVSAVAASVGDGTDATIAGIVVTAACFASKFLPEPGWLPVPPDPAAPGAAGRLLVILAGAAAVFAFASSDPAAATARPRSPVRRNHTREAGREVTVEVDTTDAARPQLCRACVDIPPRSRSWESEAALADLAWSEPHKQFMADLRPEMAPTTFTRWTVSGGDGRPSWRDGLARLSSG